MNIRNRILYKQIYITTQWSTFQEYKTLLYLSEYQSRVYASRVKKETFHFIMLRGNLHLNESWPTLSLFTFLCHTHFLFLQYTEHGIMPVLDTNLNDTNTYKFKSYFSTCLIYPDKINMQNFKTFFSLANREIFYFI